MLAAILVEVQGPPEGVEDLGRRVPLVALLEAGVVVRAHRRQDGDLFSAQAAHPAYALLGQADVVRADRCASCPEEVAECPRCHLQRLDPVLLSCLAVPHPGWTGPSSPTPSWGRLAACRLRPLSDCHP